VGGPEASGEWVLGSWCLAMTKGLKRYCGQGQLHFLNPKDEKRGQTPTLKTKL
jgi:hypothetical protein